MSASRANRWRQALPWALTLLAAYFLYRLTRDLQWSSLLRSAAQVPLWVWLLSIGGFVLSHGLRAGRIRDEWQGRLQMPWHVSWAMTVRHAAWVVLAPMRSGEAIYVWTLHRQGGVELGQAARSLIRLRLQDLVVLLLWTLLLVGPGPWALRLAVCMGLLLVVARGLPRLLQAASRLRRLDGPGDTAGFSRSSTASWAYALSNWPVKFMALALPLQSLVALDPKAAWVAALGGEWASLLPVQPIAGYGVYEAGVVAGARWITPIAIAEMAAAALFVHTLSLAVTLGSAGLARVTGWSRAELRRGNPELR